MICFAFQAYFLRAVHMEPSGLRNMIVITNDWHMPRTKAIFNFVFGLPYSNSEGGKLGGGGGGDGLCSSQAYRLAFKAAAAGVSDEHLLQVRRDKEASALAQFESSLKPQLRSFREMHKWIFTKHNAYSTARLVSSNVSNVSDIPVDLLKTY